MAAFTTTINVTRYGEPVANPVVTFAHYGTFVGDEDGVVEVSIQMSWNVGDEFLFQLLVYNPATDYAVTVLKQIVDGEEFNLEMMNHGRYVYDPAYPPPPP